jgi:anaphase-promoting complex subunit 8
VNEDDEDIFIHSKSLFDNREFLRSSHVIQQLWLTQPSTIRQNFKLDFLYYYSLYLHNIHCNESEFVENRSIFSNSGSTRVSSSVQLLQKVNGIAEKAVLDPFCGYIYGLLLRDIGNLKQAKDVLFASGKQCPSNWSLWLDLAALIEDEKELEVILDNCGTIKHHYMFQFFLAHIYVELHCLKKAVAIYYRFIKLFPKSSYIKLQIAKIFYVQHEFNLASNIFHMLQDEDPYRIDSMDIFSNILYIHGKKAAISTLLQKLFKIDKFRPEVSCILGNYYSLIRNHEQSIVHFQHALRINPDYVSAWTLMGHEYVELHNLPSAIESYRRAILFNPREYRAWHGLGQAYELLSQFNFASYYYRKAVLLKPTDSRLWIALGTVYEQMDRINEAISSFDRALKELNVEFDIIAVLKLAQLYKSKGDISAACKYYALYVQDCEVTLQKYDQNYNKIDVSEFAESLLYLAKQALVGGRFDAAESYANRLLPLPIAQVTVDAKNILNEIEKMKLMGTVEQNLFNEEERDFSASGSFSARNGLEKLNFGLMSGGNDQNDSPATLSNVFDADVIPSPIPDGSSSGRHLLSTPRETEGVRPPSPSRLQFS